MVKEQTIYVQLFGGEQDGFSVETKTVDGKWPDVFYVHRACDNKRISDAERTGDPELIELTNYLAILAYEFKQADPKEGVKGGKQYRYDRAEHADRKLTDPAL